MNCTQKNSSFTVNQSDFSNTMNLKNVHFLKMPTNTNTSHIYTPHNQSAEGTPNNEFGSSAGGGGWRSKQNLTGNSTGYDDSNRSRLMTPPINPSMLSKKINTQRGSMNS